MSCSRTQRSDASEAQHNTVPPVKFKPGTSLSQITHSITALISTSALSHCLQSQAANTIGLEGTTVSHICELFIWFLTNTYVPGTQKNHLFTIAMLNKFYVQHSSQIFNRFNLQHGSCIHVYFKQIGKQWILIRFHLIRIYTVF